MQQATEVNMNAVILPLRIAITDEYLAAMDLSRKRLIHIVPSLKQFAKASLPNILLTADLN
jgi:hypothetical protein